MESALRRIGKDAFGATPDTSFYFSSRSHREVFSDLISAIDCDRPFAALVGKPGTGKTTLLFRILEHYRNTARTAFIFQSQCNARELMQYLLTDCDIDLPTQDIVSMHTRFNEVLIETHRAGKRFLLLLDEAHNFDEPTIESIRLLSDFETPKKKLVQIIFSGQPALDEVLARPGMMQVRQRISLFRTLEPLSREEITAYIAHRLKIAGVTQELFSPVSLELIADLTGGIPREIHNLCFAALSVASTMERPRVSGDMIYAVARDLRMLPGDQQCDEGSCTEWQETQPVSVEQVEQIEQSEPQRASAAAVSSHAVTAVSSVATEALPTWTSAPDAPAVDSRPDFFAVHRPIDSRSTDAGNHPFAPNDSPDLLSRKGRHKVSGKKILVTAAALGIVSGCAVFAWVQGVNGKVNDLVSAQPLLAKIRSQPAQATEETTQEPVVAAMPRPPTKKHPARQIVSEPTNGHTDFIGPQSSADDADAPTAVTDIQNGAEANGVLTAAVTSSMPVPVRAPAPPPVSSFVLSKLIESPRPTYPPAARSAGVSGEVELEAIIATDGKLRDIRVLRGHPLLNAAAIKAAERQRYTPYLLNGSPKEVSTRVRFVFKP